jgi:hypothetical protein
MHGTDQAAGGRAAGDRERQKKFKGESKASDEVRVFLGAIACDCRPTSVLPLIGV